MLYTEERPWGNFTILHEESTMKVKRIIVYPEQRLSYQYHKKRSERWTIVEGEGIFTLNGVDRLVQTGDVLNIGLGDAHRIKNVGKGNLVFVEVQLGESFEESDIFRIEDDYNRSSQ